MTGVRCDAVVATDARVSRGEKERTTLPGIRLPPELERRAEAPRDAGVDSVSDIACLIDRHLKKKKEGKLFEI